MTEFKVSKAGTTISIGIEDGQTIEVGQAIAIRGEVKSSYPLPQDMKVTILVEEPDGSKYTIEVNVVVRSERGVYKWVLHPQIAGNWKFKASWTGDVNHLGSESREVVVKVSESKEVTVRVTPQPNYPLQVVISLVVSVVLLSLFVFLRRSRKRKHKFKLELKVEREVEKYEEYLRILEELYRKGKVSRKIYSDLKEFYEKKLEELGESS